MSYDPLVPHDLKFLPPHVNFKNLQFMDPLIKARAELAELKGYSETIPNQIILLSPAIIKESLASSEIENINTTIINVLENQLYPEAEQKIPDKEVLRYRDAVIAGFNNLEQYSVSTRTILKVHKSLLISAGGVYRNLQVGIKNDKTGAIVYMPPEASRIQNLMKNLEDFANDEKGIDPLIKCAILHYQFEAIHPFFDGNGRTGRILMVLYLVESKILTHPTLYISGYINRNKSRYYDLLLGITKKQNWNEYILFMLEGFYQQAKETKELLFKIRKERSILKDKMKKENSKIYSADFIETLFAYPIITPVKLSEKLNIHWTTAKRHLDELLKSGVLAERKVGKYHLYIHKNLINILHAR